MTTTGPPAVGDTVHAFVGPMRVLAAGAAVGPLAGASLAVKDVIDVAGTVTGGGNPTFSAGRAPARVNAAAVQALVDGGATVIGKTITDELAYSLSGTNLHYGTPVNRAAPGHIPGGSSAGSAAAVAARLCDLALGTDTGGSIRVPASYCGILGWRPTHGLVDDRGIVHLARSFDTVGLLARDARVLLAGAELLTGRALRTDPDVVAVPVPVPVPVPVAVVTELLDLVDDGARASVANGFGRHDHVDLGVDLDAAARAFRFLQGREAWTEHGAWITEVQPAMGSGIAARFAAAARVTDEEVEWAQPVRDSVRQIVVDATAGGRVLLGPAAAGAAPPLDASPDSQAATRARTLQLTCLAGLSGAPVVVLPLAHDHGLPLGVAALGAPGSDLALLQWAADRVAG